MATRLESNRAQQEGVDHAIKETSLVDLYRLGKLTHHELALALGISRLEAEAVLKRHNVTEDLASDAEYKAALSHLREKTAK